MIKGLIVRVVLSAAGLEQQRVRWMTHSDFAKHGASNSGYSNGMDGGTKLLALISRLGCGGGQQGAQNVGYVRSVERLGHTVPWISDDTEGPAGPYDTTFDERQQG